MSETFERAMAERQLRPALDEQTRKREKRLQEAADAIPSPHEINIAAANEAKRRLTKPDGSINFRQFSDERDRIVKEMTGLSTKQLELQDLAKQRQLEGGALQRVQERLGGPLAATGHGIAQILSKPAEVALRNKLGDDPFGFGIRKEAAKASADTARQLATSTPTRILGDMGGEALRFVGSGGVGATSGVTAATVGRGAQRLSERLVPEAIAGAAIAATQQTIGGEDVTKEQVAADLLLSPVMDVAGAGLKGLVDVPSQSATQPPAKPKAPQKAVQSESEAIPMELGAGLPAPQFSKGFRSAAKDLAGAQDMATRVRDTASDPVMGQIAYDALELGNARSKVIRGEIASTVGDRAEKVLRRANVHQLTKPVRGSHETWRIPFYDLIEGKVAPVAGKAGEFVSAAQDVVRQIGEIGRREGHLTIGPDGQPKLMAPGDIEGGTVASRQFSPTFYRLIQKGSGEDYDLMVRSFARANDIPEAQVRNAFEQQLASINDPSAITGTKGAFDVSRSFKTIPHGIERSNGDVLWLVERDPQKWLQRHMDNAAMSIGSASVLGQQFEPNAHMKLIAKRLDGESLRNFQQALRVMKGHPVSTIETQLAPSFDGFYARTAAHLVKEAKTSVGTAMLTLSLPKDIFEPLGAIRAMGTRRTIKSAGSLFRGKLKNELEAIGAINRDFYNVHFDPRDPVGSASRAFNETVNWIRTQANEATEFLAANNMRLAVDEWRTGSKLTRHRRDKADLMAMGFTPTQADQMIQGRASDDLYNRAITKAAAFFAPGNQTRLDKSVLENSRIFSNLVPFQTWISARARRINGRMGVVRQLANEAEILQRPLSSASKDFYASVAQLLNEELGTAAAGLAGVATIAYLKDGEQGTEAFLSQLENEPAKLILGAHVTNSLAGGAGLAMNSGNYDSVLEAIMPIKVAGMMGQAIMGTGRYRDRSPEDRWLKFLSDITPITQTGKTGVLAKYGPMIVYGKHNDTARQMRAATRQLRRWEGEQGLFDGMRNLKSDDTNYRLHMRKAYDQFSKGDIDASIQSMIQAYGIKAEEGVQRPMNSVKQSLRTRMTISKYELTGTETPQRAMEKLETMDQIRKRIGEDNIRTLQKHDLILKGLIDALP